MKNIKWYANLLKILCYILVPLLTIGFIMKWWFFEKIYYIPNESAAYAKYFGEHFDLLNLPVNNLLIRILGFLIDGVAFFILIWGFITLIKLMNYFSKGEIFSQQTINLFSRLSKLAFTWAIYTPIKDSFITTIMSLQNPPGHRIIQFAFTSSDIFNIFIFGFFVVISLIMQEGYKLKSEQDLTV